MFFIFSAALYDLDNKRDELYQKVKEAVEAYKTEVIQNQQKYLKEAQEKKNEIETRKAVMIECFKETDQFMNNENPIDIIHYSKDILLSVEESVKVGEGFNSFPSYETKLFQPQNHNNFIEQVVGKIVTEMINMPVHPIWKMPVKATLAKPLQTGSTDGCSVAGSVKLFQPHNHDNHDNLNGQVAGKLVTEKNMINMPGLATRKMPVKGTLVKSWQTKGAQGGYSVAGGIEGDIHVVTGDGYNLGLHPYYLETFDQEGNRKKCIDIDIGQYYGIRGLVSVHINDMDMIVLSAGYSVEIIQSHDGKLIDSLPSRHGFEPYYNAPNAICMTPDNKILVCSCNGKVMEFEVRNMKIVQTEKTLYLRITDVRGLCHVTYDNRQLVIATSYRDQQITAVDYHTRDVVWQQDNPVCEGIPMTPMGITHDGEGNLFISDSKNRRICLMTPDGEIHHSLLQNTNAFDFWHLAWLPDQRRLVVKDREQGLYLYDISFDQN